MMPVKIIGGKPVFVVEDKKRIPPQRRHPRAHPVTWHQVYPTPTPKSVAPKYPVFAHNIYSNGHLFTFDDLINGDVVYKIESKSSPGKYYLVRHNTNMETFKRWGEWSCNCFGWSRRILPDGTRSCKHTEKLMTFFKSKYKY